MINFKIAVNVSHVQQLHECFTLFVPHATPLVCIPQRYLDEAMRTYTWTPVNGTDYR